MRWLALGLSPLLGLFFLPGRPAPARVAGGCPEEMVRVRGYCIDRYEIATVDSRTGQALSPYYPPQARLVSSIVQAWTLERRLVGTRAARSMPLPELPEVQRSGADYLPRAVSRAGVVPQGYLSYHLAKAACENAGKRLCSEEEWVTACRGESARKFPYGTSFAPAPCNVYRSVHPAYALHRASFYGHRDPRLNLVVEADGSPLLRPTGGSPGCFSRWGADRIHDMVGNLDEWIDDPDGAFLGGFYARATREGCESRIGSHALAYYDYSIGTRCCAAAR